MTVDQACEDVGQIGVGVGAGEFAALDETGQDGPVLGAHVAAGEECILPVQGAWRVRRGWCRARRGRLRGTRSGHPSVRGCIG